MITPIDKMNDILQEEFKEIKEKERICMINNNDTIVAQATVPGESGIAIVRISGDQSFRILNEIFETRSEKLIKDHYLTYGHIKGDNGYIDECMAVKMRKPMTYTREDIVEIQCHGSQLQIQQDCLSLAGQGSRDHYK